MRTRLVRTRRRGPGRVPWAVALMVVTLCAYIWAADRAQPFTGGDVPADRAASGDAGPRVTEDVRLEALSLYAIQFGIFDNPENARVEAARYVRRGAAGYLMEGGGTRVLGAGYRTREEAEKVKAQLKEDEGIEARVHEVSARSVLLRVTASQAQIDALRGAESELRAATDALGALSFSLDRGQIDKNAAEAEVKRLSGRVRAARETLVAQSGEQSGAVASELLDIMASYETNASDALADSDSTTLSFSSKMKYNYIDARVRHIAYLSRLSAG